MSEPAKIPVISFTYYEDGAFEGSAPPALSGAMGAIPWLSIIAALIADAPAVWALIQQIINQIKPTPPAPVPTPGK